MGGKNSKQKKNIPSTDRDSLDKFDTHVLHNVIDEPFVADENLLSFCGLNLTEHLLSLADIPEQYEILMRQEELKISKRQTISNQAFHFHTEGPENYIGRSTTKQLKESEELSFHRHSHFQTRAPNSCKEEIAQELKKCKELDSDIHFAFQTGTDKSCKELSSTKEIKPLHELNLLNTSHTLETPMDCKELTKTDESKEYKELDLNMHTLSKTEANADYREVITKEDLKNTSLDYSSNFSLPDTSLENKDKDTSMEIETAPVNIFCDFITNCQMDSNSCKEKISEELKECKELGTDLYFVSQTGRDKSCEELSSIKEIKPLHELNLLNTSSHTLETPMDCKKLAKTDESKECKELDLNLHSLSKTEANADYREVITKEDLKNTSLDYSSNFSLPNTPLDYKDKDISMQIETAPVNICCDFMINCQMDSDANFSRDTKHSQNLDDFFDIKHDSNSIQHSPKSLDDLNQDTLDGINLVNDKDTSDDINPMNDEKNEKTLKTSNKIVYVDLNSGEFNFENDINRAGLNIENKETIPGVDAINKAQGNDSILLGDMNISDTTIDIQPEEYYDPQSVSNLIECEKANQIQRKKEKRKRQKEKKQNNLLKDVTCPENSYVGEEVTQVCEDISEKDSINDASMEKLNSVNFTEKPGLAASDIKENYERNAKMLEADQYKKQGNQLYSLKHYTEAVGAYSKAICLNPANYIFFSNRSASHIMIRNFKQAAEDAEKAVEINHSFEKGFLRLAKCYIALGLGPLANITLQKCRNLCFTKEDLKVKKEEVLEEITRSFNLIMKMERGDEAMKNGNFAKALSYYQPALEIAVADVYLFLRVANCLIFLKRLNEVLLLIKSIPEELMEEEEVSFLKGLYFYYVDAFSEAKEHLLKVKVELLKTEVEELLKKIDGINKYYLIIDEAMWKKDLKVVLHTLKSGLKIDPYNYNVNAKFHYFRGLCCMLQESWSDAIYFFTEAISLKEDFLEAYHQRGKCFYHIKAFEDAAADFKICG